MFETARLLPQFCGESLFFANKVNTPVLTRLLIITGGKRLMEVSNIISLLGGVAMFLFGMSVMGDSLKKVAGSKMEMVLYRLAGNTPKGILLGTAVTAVIQSSSATSVMVVGFVNSGMMTVKAGALLNVPSILTLAF